MAITYEPLTTITLTSNTDTVSIGSIPQTYTDLILIINAGAITAGSGIYMRFNTDTSPSGTNYSVTNLIGNGSTARSFRAEPFNAILPAWFVGVGASIDYINTINIMNYSNTTTFKTVLSRGSRITSETDPGAVACVNLWRDTSAINAIQLTLANTFKTGSTFTLYGILKA